MSRWINYCYFKPCADNGSSCVLLDVVAPSYGTKGRLTGVVQKKGILLMDTVSVESCAHRYLAPGGRVFRGCYGGGLLEGLLYELWEATGSY